MHPSPHERLVALAILKGIAARLHRRKQDEAASLFYNDRDDTYLNGRFTAEQAETLEQRFEELDGRLRLPDVRQQPSFQGGPSPYEPNDMPADFTVEDFIAGWNGGPRLSGDASPYPRCPVAASQIH